MRVARHLPRIALVALVATSGVVASGCHDRERLQERLEGPPTRLPVEPDQPDIPPVPALLDTVLPWRQPKLFGDRVTATWQLVTLDLPGSAELTYRVPESWIVNAEKANARNAQGGVVAQGRVTDLDDSDISLATYAAQLAEGNPIYQYTTLDGHVVYLTRREVALAPSDPDARREFFHTAVVSVDGTIAKLDVRYDSPLDWRFDELASAITGTLQVRHPGS